MPLEKSSRRQLEKQKQNQQSRTRASKAQAEITVEIDLSSRKLADTIYNTLLPETQNQPKGFRSRTTVRKNNRVVALNITADDIVALRAASNTYLRFVQVALKTIRAISPFYRAADRGPESSDNLGKKIE